MWGESRADVAYIYRTGVWSPFPLSLSTIYFGAVHMKVSLIALGLGCAIASSAFVVFDLPPVTPPRVAMADLPPVTPPRVVLADLPPVTPPRMVLADLPPVTPPRVTLADLPPVTPPRLA
jgi:hypothetical protein